MKQTFLAKAAELLRASMRRKRWYRVCTGLAAAVVFVTTYMLILPAITLTSDQGAGAVPLGVDLDMAPDYTAELTLSDDSVVTIGVYDPDGNVPEGAVLSAELYEEDSEDYAKAEADLLDSGTVDSYDGMLAMDIHFEDADGVEVEPDGQVYVDLRALLPENVDPDSVAVQHHMTKESDGLFGWASGQIIEVVADNSEDTGDIVVEQPEDLTPAEGETPVDGEQPAEGEETEDGEEPAEGETTPESETPAESGQVDLPEEGTPAADGPEETAPETTPETTAPEVTAPETTTPEETTPESAPETTTPETTTPEVTAPETSAPETTVPETTAPETSAPETSAPETTTPAESTVAEAAPAETGASMEATFPVDSFSTFTITWNVMEEILEEEVPLGGIPEEILAGEPDYIAEIQTEDGRTVTVNVYDPNGYVPEGAELKADLLAEDSEEYAEAQANLDASDAVDEYAGMAALDIRFEDADGSEVEPAGQVYVDIQAQALIPEDADPDSVAVQHHVETTEDHFFGLIETKEVAVQVVADSSAETGDVTVTPSEVTIPDEATALSAEPGETADLAAETEETAAPAAQDVEAQFAVESFSTFTITYDVMPLAETGSNNLVWTKTWRDNDWPYKERSVTRKFTDTASLYVIDRKTGEELGDYVTVNKNIGSGEVSFSTVVNDLLTQKGYSADDYAPVDFYLIRNGERVDFTDSKFGNWYIWPNNTSSAKFGMRPLDKKFGSDDQYVEAGDQYYIVVTYIKDIGTITTSDNEAIHFNLYNYSDNYCENFSSGFPFGGAGWTGVGGGVTQGLVENQLENGYPVLKAASGYWENGTWVPGYERKSMDDLFSDADGDKTGVVAYSPKNTLLSYNSETGYYTYDSDLNFAKYDTTTGKFVVYDSPNWTVSDTDPPRFLPFNEITDATGDADFRFGMTMDFDFIMPKNGEVNDENMVFKFRGDDDVWVYIDGKLVLDLGGVHDKYEGYINFATGEIYVESVAGNGTANASKTINIWSLYGYDSYAEWEAAWRYDTHTLNFFYLERGEGGSNCKIEFNMPAIPSNSLLVGKTLTDGTNTNPLITEYLEDTLSYTFQVLKVKDGAVTNESFLTAGTTFQIMKDGVLTERTGTVNQDGTFTIKAGETAVFNGAIKADSGQYVVREIMESDYTGQYEGVGFTVSGTGGTTEEQDADKTTATDFTHYETDFISAETKTTTVTFNNRVDVSKLSLLKVTKAIAPGANIDADTEFPIVITLDGESIAGVKYTITDAQGHTGTTQTVGADGIIFIKGGETINITEGILVGTRYEVSEQNDDGYYVTYEGMVTWTEDGETETDRPDFDGAETASDTFEHTNSVVYVAVQNADYEFAGQTTLFKYLDGAEENDQYTFTFEAVEGTFIEENYTFTPGTAEPWTFTVDTQGNSGFTDFVVGYKTSDFQAEDFDQEGNAFRYYKVQEIAQDDGIRYDTGYYIVKVEISNTVATNLEIGVTGVHVYRFTAEGTYVPAEISTRGISEAMYFTNSVVGELSISKVVARTDSQKAAGTGFSFTVDLKDATFNEAVTATVMTMVLNETTGAPELDEGGNYTYTEAIGTEDVRFDKGVATITLDHGQTIVIPDLPAADSAQITETDTSRAGYSTKWTGDTYPDGNEVVGADVTTAQISTNPSVTCTNTTGAVLPSTGGMGTTPFVTLGSLCTLGAGLLLLAQRRRKGGSAAA